MAQIWKEDWERAKSNLTKWWKREGPALCITAPKDRPWVDLPKPEVPADQVTRWTDPEYRARRAEYEISRTFYGGEAFPLFDAHIGPGSLGMILGARPEFAPSTVWYHACIDDPETYPPIRFDPSSKWFKVHMDILRRGREIADERSLVVMPDLIENIDTLAMMRDSQTLMLDLVERPQWIEKCVNEINAAYFQVFDAMYDAVKFDGGNAFSAFRIWGEGKTAKLQCDAAAMISPAMFDRFVVPGLREQCQRLDNTLFHLDGTQALCHVDLLLGIEQLDAIQWTPQPGIEGSGHPRWYDLYRKMLRAGKSVQALWMKPDEVIPLLQAVGPSGVFAHAICETESEARRLLDAAEQFR